jgi:hypothetical protein
MMPLKLIEISCFLILQLQVEYIYLAERAGNIHTISLHRGLKKHYVMAQLVIV